MIQARFLAVTVAKAHRFMQKPRCGQVEITSSYMQMQSLLSKVQLKVV